MPEPTHENKKSPATALILGFLPTPIALVLLPNLALTHQMGHFHGIVGVAACVLSVNCCFASSFMLFAHGNRSGNLWNILLGVLFPIWNGLISFALLLVGLTEGAIWL
jgi:hypothetical protein